jgi:hypothetical protein
MAVVVVAAGAEAEAGVAVEVRVVEKAGREVEFRLASESGLQSKQQNFLVRYSQPEK